MSEHIDTDSFLKIIWQSLGGKSDMKRGADIVENNLKNLDACILAEKENNETTQESTTTRMFQSFWGSKPFNLEEMQEAGELCKSAMKNYDQLGVPQWSVPQSADFSSPCTIQEIPLYCGRVPRGGGSKAFKQRGGAPPTDDEMAVGALLALAKKRDKERPEGNPGEPQEVAEIEKQEPLLISAALNPESNPLNEGEEVPKVAGATGVEAMASGNRAKENINAAKGCCGHGEGCWGKVRVMFNWTWRTLACASRTAQEGGGARWNALTAWLAANIPATHQGWLKLAALAAGSLAFGTWLAGMWTVGGVGSHVCMAVMAPLTTAYEAGQVCGVPVQAQGLFSTALQFAETYLPFGGALAGAASVGKSAVVQRYDTAARAIFVCVTGLIAVAFGGWSGLAGAAFNRIKTFISATVNIIKSWFGGEVSDVETLYRLRNVNWQELWVLIGPSGPLENRPEDLLSTDDLQHLLQSDVQDIIAKWTSPPQHHSALFTLNETNIKVREERTETVITEDEINTLIDTFNGVPMDGYNDSQKQARITFINLLKTYKATSILINSLQREHNVSAETSAALSKAYEELMDVYKDQQIDALLTAEQTLLALVPPTARPGAAAPRRGGGKTRSRKRRGSLGGSCKRHDLRFKHNRKTRHRKHKRRISRKH